MATKKHDTSGPQDILGPLTSLVEGAVKEVVREIVQSPEQRAILEAAAEKVGAIAQTVALDAFCRFRFGGKNFDQAAGFKRWIKGQKLHLSRMPESEWAALLEKFMNRRIGG